MKNRAVEKKVYTGDGFYITRIVDAPEGSHSFMLHFTHNGKKRSLPIPRALNWKETVVRYACGLHKDLTT